MVTLIWVHLLMASFKVRASTNGKMEVSTKVNS